MGLARARAVDSVRPRVRGAPLGAPNPRHGPNRDAISGRV